MNRTMVLLSVLAAILVVAMAWLLLLQPRNNEIDELRAETASFEAQEQQLQARVAALRQVREDSPDYEAQLAAAYAIIPRDTALPAVLRQLQLAADESGLTLMAVAPSRPAAATVEGGATGLARINVAVDVEGRYFQLVDFLRRLEDPAISPRALNWTSMNLSGDPEEYPLLTASLQGDLFALLPTPPAEQPVTQDPDDADVEVEVDLEAEEQDQ
jgi:Tfp pilus assembly protein PilO